MKKLILLAAIMLPLVAQSHSGGTNAAGCHINHSTGYYHCHTPKPRDYSKLTYCLHVGLKEYCGYAKSTCDELQKEYGGYCLPDY